MKILFILILIEYAICETSIKNIRIGETYEVELSDFPNNQIPPKTKQYFRMPIEVNESIELIEIEIQLRVLHGTNPEFMINVIGFSKLPSNEEVKDERNCINLPCTNVTEDKSYDIFKYRLEILENIKYLAIHIENSITLNYLSVFCLTRVEKSMEIKFQIFDILYMKEFKLNKTSLEENHNVLIFRMENENENTNSIRIKVNKELKSEIKLNVLGYTFKPNTPEDIQNFIDIKTPEKIEVAKNEEYLIYYYNYEKISDYSKYICYGIGIEDKYDYLSIYIGPKE